MTHASTSARISTVPASPATEPPASAPRLRRGALVVAAVGIDAATVALVTAAMERARIDGVLPEECELRLHRDIQDARGALVLGGSRTILLVEASALVTGCAFPPSVHVIALAGPDRRGATAGADDVVRHPLHVDELEVALRLAARSLAHVSLVPLADRILELVAPDRSGAILVSAGSESARLHVEAGRIVWIHRVGHPVGLRALLAASGVAIADETAREVVEECRRARKSFAEVLTGWAVVDAPTLARCIGEHLTRELATVTGWPRARAELVEGPAERSAAPSFEPESLLAAARARHQPRPTEASTIPSPRAGDAGPGTVDVARWLEHVLTIPGVLGCAVLDATAGRCLGLGGAIDTTSSETWSLAAAFASLGASTGELVATTPDRTFLVRELAGRGGAVSVLAFDPRRLSPAMARLHLSAAR